MVMPIDLKCSWCGRKLPTLYNHGCSFAFNEVLGSNFETEDDGTLKEVFNINKVMDAAIVCKPCFTRFEEFLNELGKNEV